MSIVCRRAAESDREELKQLWLRSFAEDTERDVILFLDTFGVADTAFVLCDNDRVCSMLFLLPITIENGDDRCAAGYVYAGATHPASRGRGYYRRLLDFVAETAKREGKTALVLRPATDALFDSYRRMGFTVPLIGNAQTVSYDLDEKSVCLTPTVYGQRRREVLRNGGQAFIDWDDRVIAYAMTWCEARLYFDDTLLFLSSDSDYVAEQLPPCDKDCHTAALLKPLEDDRTTPPIWFGYGLE